MARLAIILSASLVFGGAITCARPVTNSAVNPKIRVIQGKEYRVNSLLRLKASYVSNAAPSVVVAHPVITTTHRVPMPTDPYTTDSRRMHGAGPYTTLVNTSVDTRTIILITNYTGPFKPGQKIEVRALKLGNNYDCGEPKRTTVIRSDRKR